MTKAILPDGRQATYKYDAFGRRIKKTITDKNGHQKTTEFLWQGDNLIAETDNKEHYQGYIYEPNSFKPLALISGRGKEHKVYHYQLDHIGTPLDLTNREGKAVWSAQYLAYGTIYTQHTEEVTNPLRFQGQYFDKETGLHYNRHRYYNPKNGLFTTADPIGLAGGLNNYQYVKNPTGFVDPLGLNDCKINCPKSTSGNEIIDKDTFYIEANKFNYFYGKVEPPLPSLKLTDPKKFEKLNHNYQRSQQMKPIFESDGMGDSPAGRKKLLNMLEDAAKGAEINRHVGQHGTTVTKVAETSKVKYEVKFFYEANNLSLKPKVSTIIPKVKK